MTQQIQISGKADNGVIFVVGGSDVDDFLVNLTAATKDRQTAEDILEHAVRLITPTSAGGPAPAAPQQQVQQAVQNVQAAFPQAEQVEQCPSHNQPVRWRQRKDGSGSFAVCTVNDSIVSNFGKPGLRPSCPPPKAR